MDNFEKLYYETSIKLYEERIKNKIDVEKNLKYLKIYLNKLYILESNIKHPQYEKYTNRQIEIIRLVKKGLSNSEIAKEAFVSINTVKKHIKIIMEKGGYKSRYELIVKL